MGDKRDQAEGPYKLKPREFERVNEPIRAPVRADMPPKAHGGVDPVSDTPSDEGGLERIHAGEAPPTRKESPGNSGNDVRGMLRLNLESDRRRGWYRVKPGNDRTRRRRILIYWATLVAVDLPLAVIAWLSGHADPFPFVLAMAAIAYFTARLTWETWFMRTD